MSPDKKHTVKPLDQEGGGGGEGGSPWDLGGNAK